MHGGAKLCYREGLLNEAKRSRGLDRHDKIRHKNDGGIRVAQRTFLHALHCAHVLYAEAAYREMDLRELLRDSHGPAPGCGGVDFVADSHEEELDEFADRFVIIDDEDGL